MTVRLTAPIREHDEAHGITAYELRYDDEPALLFRRTVGSKQNDYLLPLSEAYRVTDERELMKMAFVMANELRLLSANAQTSSLIITIPDKQGDKSVISTMMDILTKHIDNLVSKIPPAPVETRLDFENELDRSGVKSMKVNGQELLH